LDRRLFGRGSGLHTVFARKRSLVGLVWVTLFNCWYGIGPIVALGSLGSRNSFLSPHLFGIGSNAANNLSLGTFVIWVHHKEGRIIQVEIGLGDG
jgi:hypothetical protein